MNHEWLLEKKDSSKIELLQYVESYVEQAVPVWQIQADLELSDFLLKKRMEEIHLDIQALDLEDDVQFYEQDGFIRLKTSGGANSSVFVHMYIENSLMYQLLTSIVQQKFSSIQQFADEHFVSYAKIYQIMGTLKTQLRMQGILIEKNNQLAGTAATIQNVLFQVYRHQTVSFLSPIIENEIEQKIRFVLSLNGVEASPRQIQELRTYHLLRQRFGFPQVQFSEGIHYFLEQCVRQMKGRELLNKAILSEMALYMYTELNWFGDQQLEMPEAVRKNVGALLVQVQATFDLGQSPSVMERLYAALSRVYTKYMYFPSMERELYSRQDMLYFEEVYPTLVTFLKTSVEFEAPPEAYQSFLFLQTLLILIRLVPAEKRATKCKVFVDFTVGAEYNAFIQANLRTIENFSLEVVDVYTHEVDIVLTNTRHFYTDKNQEVIIWLEPPTPKDWENFGNRLKQRQKVNK